MKKAKWTIVKLLLWYFAVMITIYSVCVIWVFAARAAEPSFNPKDYVNIYENIYDEDNFVFEWEVYKLHEGMDDFEMYNYLGKAQRIAGTGNLIVEYYCFSGRYLYVLDSGTYFFSDEQMFVFEGQDVEAGPVVAPIAWCCVASAVIVIGGYLMRALRKRNIAVYTTTEAVSDTTVPKEDA